MVPVEDMEIFARVVASGSMTAASRELDISTAVVSKRIRKLEDRLGARLLQRTTRQLSLTETGQGYYQRIVAILASIEEAENFISRRNASAKGVLKVSAPTSFGRLHVAPHLGPLLRQNPGLDIHLVLSDEYVDLVGEGYDVALRIGELNDSSLVARRLAANHRVICAAPSYLAAHGTPLSIAELQAHNCLTFGHHDIWRLVGPHGPEHVKVNGNLHTNSSEVVREAVLAGIGIALRSTWDIGPDLKQSRLQIVLPDYHASSRVAIYAVFPSRRFLPVKVRVLIDYLSDLYSDAPYWDEGLQFATATGGEVKLAAAG